MSDPWVFSIPSEASAKLGHGVEAYGDRNKWDCMAWILLN